MPSVTHLTVHGFKSIAGLDRFEVGSLNLLIGPNGSGKSNLLDLFRMFAAMATERLRLFVAKEDGPDALLHRGRRHMSDMEFELALSNGAYRYAQSRYEELPGWNAPAAGGPPQRSLTGARRRIDAEAWRTIAAELGHSRAAISSVYCGARGGPRRRRSLGGGRTGCAQPGRSRTPEGWWDQQRRYRHGLSTERGRAQHGGQGMAGDARPRIGAMAQALNALRGAQPV